MAANTAAAATAAAAVATAAAPTGAATVVSQVEELMALLVELEAVQTGEAPSSDPATLVDSISRLVVAMDPSSNRTSADRCNALLFDQHATTSLVSFMTKTTEPAYAKVKSFGDARAKIYVFIGNYLALMGKALRDYALQLKDSILLCYAREVSAAPKVASLAPLTTLLGTRWFSADEWDLTQVFSQLFKDLRLIKLGQTVRGQILHSLGRIVDWFPTAVDKSMTKDLFDVCYHLMKKQFSSSKPEMQLLGGAINCIAYVVGIFPEFLEDAPADVQTDLYRFIFQTALSIPEGMKRFDVPRFALWFVGKHATLFSTQVDQDFEGMFVRLLLCCHSKHSRVRKAAPAAFNACLHQISGKVSQASERARFETIVANLRLMLAGKPACGIDRNPHVQYDAGMDLQLAVRTCGILAPAIAAFMGQQSLQSMIIQLMTACDRILGSVTDAAATAIGSQHRRIMQQAECLVAFSCLLKQLTSGEIDPVLLERLQTCAGALVVAFPSLPEPSKRLVCRALSVFLAALSGKGSTLRQVISQITFPALVRALSRVTPDEKLDLTHPVTGLRDDRLLFEYTILWRHLLDPTDSDTLQLLRQPSLLLQMDTDSEGDDDDAASFGSDAVIMPRAVRGVDDDDEEDAMFAPDDGDESDLVVDCCRVLYDALMTDVLKLMTSLDLSVVVDSTDVPASASAAIVAAGGSTAGSTEMHPTAPRDYDLFLNLVEFLQVLVPVVRASFFPRWMFLISKNCVQLAAKYPHVSGFFKILHVAVQVADGQGYFQPLKPDTIENINTRSIVHCQILLQRFVTNVAVRIRLYKEELLVACLSFLLSVPSCLVKASTLLPAVQLALRAGVSHTPLGLVAIACLERWAHHDFAYMEPHLPELLPMLGDYLSVDARAVGDSLAVNQAVAAADPTLTTRDAARRARKRAVGAYSASASMFKAQVESTNTSALVSRVLLLMGRLGGFNRAATGDIRQAIERGIAWDTRSRLPVSLPMGGKAVQVNLDRIVPQAVALALRSSSRPTKVAACEFLHSCILYMVGAQSTVAKSQQQAAEGGFAPLYRHIFPAVIQLATDLESVARQLFETLTIQLVHWFTQFSKTEREEASLLLDAISEGVCSDDAGVRSFCARCLAEFLKYSIKHSTDTQLEDNPVNVDALVRRLVSIGRHPNAYHRLGAMTTINTMYREFREQAQLVSRYALELTDTVLFALRLAHYDPPALGTGVAACGAVDHMERILVQCAPDLCAPLLSRKGPADLAQFVSWLWGECGRPENKYRRKCMQLFHALAGTLPGVPNPKQWVTSQMASGALTLQGVFGPHSTELPPTSLIGNNDPQSLVALKSWWNELSTTADGYLWLVRNQYMPVEQLFWPATARAASTATKRKRDDGAAAAAASGARVALLTQIQHFFDTQAELTLDELVEDSSTLLGQAEVDVVARQRAILVCRLFWLIAEAVTVDPSCVQRLMADQVISAQFCRVAALCVLNPAATGTATVDSEAESQVTAAVSRALEVLVPVPPVRRLLVSAVIELIRMSLYNFDGLDGVKIVDSPASVPALVRAYRMLHKCGLLAACGVDLAGLARRLGLLAFDLPAGCTPLVVQVASGVVDLAVDLGWQAVGGLDSVLGCLLSTISPAYASFGSLSSPSQVTQTSTAAEATASTKGYLFYSRFKQALLDRMLAADSWDAVVDELMATAADQPQSRSLLFDMLDYYFGRSKAIAPVSAAGTKPVARPLATLEAFVSAVSCRLSLLSAWNSGSATPGTQHCLVELLIRLAKCKPWLLSSSLLAPLATTFVSSSLQSLFSSHAPLDVVLHALQLMPYLMPGFGIHAPVPAPEIAPATLVLSSMPKIAVKCLQALVAERFPVISTDLAAGSVDAHQHRQLLNALLGALVTSGSIELLQILNIALREGNAHAFATDIASALNQLASGIAPDGRTPRVMVARLCSLVFDASGTIPVAVQRMITEHLLVPLLTRLVPRCLKDMLAQPDVMDLLTPVAAAGAPRLITRIAKIGCEPDVPSTEIDIQIRTSTFQVLAAIYDVLSDTAVKELAKLFQEDSSIALTSSLCKTAYKCLTSPVSNTNAPAHLALCRAAFLCVVAVVSSMMTTQEKFLSLPLEEKKAKGTLIWDHLVDTKAPLNLSAETNFHSVRLRINKLHAATPGSAGTSAAASLWASGGGLASQAASLSWSSGAAWKPPSDSRRATSALSLLDSSARTLQSSSLASDVILMSMASQSVEEITGLGLTDEDAEPPQVSPPIASQSSAAGYSDSKGTDDISDAALSEPAINEEIELDALNSNPSMIVLLRYLDRLAVFYSTKWELPAADPEHPAGVPKASAQPLPALWKYLQDKLNDSSAPINARLFVTKAILNRPAYFAPWGRELFTSLMQVLLDAEEEHGTSRGFHYLFRDLCFVLIEWKHVIPENDWECGTASRFLNHLISVCPHKRNVLWLANLTCISSLLNQWPRKVRVNKSPIGLMLARGDGTSTAMLSDADLLVATGYELLAAIMSSGRPLYDPATDSEIPPEKFAQVLVAGMTVKPKLIYSRAAEVCGMALKAESKTNNSAMASHLTRLTTSAIAKLRSNPKQFLHCIGQLGSKFPEFVDSPVLAQVGHHVTSKACVQAVLQILLAVAGGANASSVFPILRQQWSTLVRDADPLVQRLVLDIVHKLLPLLSIDDLNAILNPSNAGSLGQVFSGHAHATCRARFYEILMWLWDNQPAFVESDSDVAMDGTPVLQRSWLRQPLLMGLQDAEEQLRVALYHFWDHQTRLASDAAGRLQQLLTRLYDSSCEIQWLQYAPHLLLALTRSGAEYEKPMFSNPLTGTSWQDQEVNLSWAAATSMEPLFSATQSQSTSRSGMPTGGLRATQADLNFSMTQSQAVGAGAAAGSGGGSAAGSRRGPDVPSSYALPSQLMDKLEVKSALVARPLNEMLSHTTDMGDGPDYFGHSTVMNPGPSQSQSQLSLSQALEASSQAPVHAPRLRVGHTQLHGSFFQRRAMSQRTQRAAQRLQQRQERQKKVTLFRKYRQGELPDILIPLQALIDPWQALCAQDSGIARLTLVELFRCMYSSVDRLVGTTIAAADSVRVQLRDALASLLGRSQLTPDFVSAIQEIAMRVTQQDVEFANDAHSSFAVLPAFVIDPNVVGHASIASVTFYSAITLLEQGLLAAGVHRPVVSALPKNSIMRGAAGVDAPSMGKVAPATAEALTSAWTQLTRLYRQLNDEELVLGLVERTSVAPDTRKALEAALSGDYVLARDTYDSLMATYDAGGPWPFGDPSVEELRGWEADRRDALCNLQQWDVVASEIMGDINDDVRTLVEDPDQRMQSLGLAVRALLRQPSLYPVLRTLLNISEKHDAADLILRKQFSADVGAAYVLMGDVVKAQVHLRDGYEQVVRTWAALTPLARAGRLSALRTMHRLTELYDFVDLCRTLDGGMGNADSIVSRVVDLMGRWRRRYPSTSDDALGMWDDVVTCRVACLGQLRDRLSSATANVLPALAAIDGVELDMYEAASVASREQGTFVVAMNYWNRFADCSRRQTGKRGLAPAELRVALQHARAKVSDSPSNALKVLNDAMDASLVKPAALTTPLERLRAQYLHGSAAVKMAQFYMANPSLASGSTATSPSDALRIAFDALQATAAGQLVVQASSDDLSSEACMDVRMKASMQFAQFCDSLLRGVEEEGTMDSTVDGATIAELVRTLLGDCEMDVQTVACEFVEATLRSMSAGYAEAVQQFPRVLDCIGRYEVTRAVFSKHISTVPVWQLLRWTPQILALLDKPEADTVIPVIVEMASKYPQAIYFPYNVTRECMPQLPARRTREIDAKLDIPVLSKLIVALNYLTHPEMRVKSGLYTVRDLLAARKTAEAKAAFAKLFESCFKQEGPLIGRKIGKINADFAKSYGQLVAQALADETASALTGDRVSSFMSGKGSAVLNHATNTPSSRPRLSEFCTWLADYTATDSDGYIEIPGNYEDLTSEPDLSLHPRVASFGPVLLQMSSMRKPKRLTVLGNDENEYLFLVKGGEDLRLDQRVESLFTAMNKILAQDPRCASRQLSIKTFKVIPMSLDIGVIEWVKNTVPLKNVCEEEFAVLLGSPQPVNLRNLKAKDMRDRWMASFSAPNELPFKQHAALAQKASAAEATTVFAHVQAAVPPFLLRNRLMAMSTSAESFLTIRTQFARSLAAFSMGSYILGIGDRHLENWLLQTTNGTLLGIDFGTAFGDGTARLPVPELIPFRLTQQFTNLLQPLDTGGLLKHNMILSMSAFQHSRSLLLNVMDVFVKDPLLEWAKAADKAQASGPAAASAAAAAAGAAGSSATSGVSVGPNTWYPQQKMDAARRKLLHGNPAYIMERDVRENTHLRTLRAADAVASIVRGQPNSKRIMQANLIDGWQCPTVEAQVDCLIEMATEPNILVRQYWGLATWV